jgi:triphosphatase
LQGFASGKLNKRHRKVKRIIAGLQAEAEQRHRLRIAVKQLRYALDCFSSLYPAKTAGEAIRILGALQDVLGHMNDLAVTESLLSRIDDRTEAFRGARNLLTGWMAAISLQSEQKLDAVLADFSRLRRFWKG